jgi:hypothetical protein
MACRILVALVLVFVLDLEASALVVQSGSLRLTIVRAETKTRDRIVYWEVNTPIYNEDPYFEVEVRVAGTVIVAERDPQNRREMLPEGWKPDTLVQGRVDSRHLYLQRPDGTEVRFVITRRTKIPSK